jgi:GNAT superfamily N-acetyltransferase
MQNFTLRPAQPELDFTQLAEWFTILEDEPNTASGLAEWYQKNQERIFQQAAETEMGELAGFYWASRSKVDPGLFYLSLYVPPERRNQGLGRQLYAAMEAGLAAAGFNRLRVSVWDYCPEGRAFAERRGFTELSYQVAYALDLESFDDRRYQPIIADFESQGFLFTSMGALGNTENAQRKLYQLNDMTSRETLGATGEPSWASFEDFQASVCQSNWYIPDGQMLAIDTASGDWVALSAITRFEGTDYAYNLHTGVDRRYRGRKLGQAIKIHALRYARQQLGVKQVRTHHNSKNLPMIAIDLKLGYTPLAGTYAMEKRFK